MTWEKVGEVGVDAGLLWLGDPCYFLDTRGGAVTFVEQTIGARYSDDELYGKFCDALGNEQPTVKSFGPAGAAISTGYGDGVYPVEIRRGDDGRVMEVRVRFD